MKASKGILRNGLVDLLMYTTLYLEAEGNRLMRNKTNASVILESAKYQELESTHGYIPNAFDKINSFMILNQ